MAEKLYGGMLPDPPMEKACDTRNRGDMPKTLVRSARRPVNMKLDSRTSFCTSREMLSRVPGLGRPRAALRSENEVYASLKAAATELSVRKEGKARESDIMKSDEILKVVIQDGRETEDDRYTRFVLVGRRKEEKRRDLVETSPEIEPGKAKSNVRDNTTLLLIEE